MSVENQDGHSVEFRCNQCGKMLRVAREVIGRRVKCPECQAVMEVPFQPEPSLQQAADSTLSHSNAPSAPAPSAFAPTQPRTVPFDVEHESTVVQRSVVQQAPTTEIGRRIKGLFDRINEQVRKIYIGQDDLVRGTLVALFSGGHVLIESVPGLGKTLLVRTLGQVLGCNFGRIQFTADLMPSDLTGAPIFNMKTQDFEFRPGPVFTQLLLADEINRSPAKTHAALLEIMQEYRVTVDRVTHKIERPFLVMATQNPIESEGTYNLPEAQLDRFMFKIVANYPTENEESNVLRMHRDEVDIDQHLEQNVSTITNPAEILEVTAACCQVRVDDRLVDYINSLVRLTREWPQFHMGASPRAGIALVQGSRTLAAFYGREYAVPDDVVEIALPALRHRVMLTAEAEVEGHKVDDLLADLIRSVEVPRL